MTDSPKTAFDAIWDTLELSSRDLDHDPGETMGRPALPPRRTLDAELPRLTGDEAPQLELGPLIGLGGMGEVWAATQVPIGREVAVKTLKQASSTRRQRQGLLREAIVSARLEHPNIVPVHLIGADGEGRPMMVMKKIAGRSWGQVLRGTPQEQQRHCGDDLLAWNLGILQQVCHALDYAHSQGIIHRDIKPDNVMIGPFAEVYMLDWGLAVSVRGEDERLPRPEDDDCTVGTPGYIAPEMLEEDGEVDERTDVYLLGAVLHELLTGQRRHLGRDTYETLLNAWRSPPVDYELSVPVELAVIANRATRRDPNDRYPAVAGFRQAIAGFLRHRQSTRLGSAAGRSLRSMELLLTGEDPQDGPELDQLFGACRFGFRAALDAWEGNQQAREGLQRTITVRIERELAVGNTGSARMLFSELPSPDAELLAAIERSERRDAAQAAELSTLRRLKRNVSLDVGHRARRGLATGLAVLWTALPVVTWGIDRSLERSVSWEEFLVPQLLAWALTFSLVRSGWAKLGANEASRRLIGSFLAMVSVLLITGVIGPALGLEARQGVVLVASMVGVMVCILSITVDRRMAAAIPGFLLATVVGAFAPRYSLLLLGLANLLAFVTVAFPRARHPVSVDQGADP